MESDTYMANIYTIANMYVTDVSFVYDNALCACRDIARDFHRQSEEVYADFETACDYLQGEYDDEG